LNDYNNMLYPEVNKISVHISNTSLSKNYVAHNKKTVVSEIG